MGSSDIPLPPPLPPLPSSAGGAPSKERVIDSVKPHSIPAKKQIPSQGTHRPPPASRPIKSMSVEKAQSITPQMSPPYDGDALHNYHKSHKAICKLAPMLEVFDRISEIQEALKKPSHQPPPDFKIVWVSDTGEKITVIPPDPENKNREELTDKLQKELNNELTKIKSRDVCDAVNTLRTQLKKAKEEKEKTEEQLKSQPDFQPAQLPKSYSFIIAADTFLAAASEIPQTPLPHKGLPGHFIIAPSGNKADQPEPLRSEIQAPTEVKPSKLPPSNTKTEEDGPEYLMPVSQTEEQLKPSTLIPLDTQANEAAEKTESSQKTEMLWLEPGQNGQPSDIFQPQIADGQDRSAQHMASVNIGHQSSLHFKAETGINPLFNEDRKKAGSGTQYASLRNQHLEPNAKKNGGIFVTKNIPGVADLEATLSYCPDSKSKIGNVFIYILAPPYPNNNPVNRARIDVIFPDGRKCTKEEYKKGVIKAAENIVTALNKYKSYAEDNDLPPIPTLRLCGGNSEALRHPEMSEEEEGEYIYEGVRSMLERLRYENASQPLLTQIEFGAGKLFSRVKIAMTENSDPSVPRGVPSQTDIKPPSANTDTHQPIIKCAHHRDGMFGYGEDTFNKHGRDYAIVNAANSLMAHGGGIARRISLMAGTEYNELTQAHPTPSGDVYTCGSYDIQKTYQHCKLVHNAVAPDKRLLDSKEITQEQYRQQFKEVFVRLLEETSKSEMSTVCCLLGCSIFGGNGEDLAQALFDAQQDPKVQQLQPTPELHLTAWFPPNPPDDKQVWSDFQKKYDQLQSSISNPAEP